MTCPTCGAPVDPDDFWCHRCATRLREPQVVAPAAAAAPANPHQAYVPPITPDAPPAVSRWPAPAVAAPASRSRASRVQPRAVVVLAVVAVIVTVNLVQAASNALRSHPGRTQFATNSFVVEFPAGAPSVGVQYITVDAADSGTSQRASEIVGDRTIAVEWLALSSSESDAAVMTARCNSLRNQGYDLRSSVATTVDGKRALDCRYFEGAGEAAYEELIVVDRGTMYLLETHAATTTGLDQFRAFVASFQLRGSA